MNRRRLDNMFHHFWDHNLKSGEPTLFLCPVNVDAGVDKDNDYIFLGHFRRHFEKAGFTEFYYHTTDAAFIILIDPVGKFKECEKAIKKWLDREDALADEINKTSFNETFWEGADEFLARVSEVGGGIQASVDADDIADDEISIYQGYQLWNWMQDTINGRVYSWRHDGYWIGAHCWRFEKEEDAVLFKVTWQGRFNEPDEDEEDE